FYVSYDLHPFISTSSMSSVIFITIQPPTKSTLFPYTTLFRSRPAARCGPGPAPCPWRRDQRDPCRSRWHRERRRWCSSNRRDPRSEEHTSELQSLAYLVCRLLLEKKN